MFMGFTSACHISDFVFAMFHVTSLPSPVALRSNFWCRSEQASKSLNSSGKTHGFQLAFNRYPGRGWKIWKALMGPETASPKDKSLWMISMSKPLWCCLFFSTSHQKFKQIGWFWPWIPWTHTSDQDRLKPCLWKGKKTIQMVDDGLLTRTIHEPQNPSIIYCIDLYSQHPKKPWSGCGPTPLAMASSCNSWVLIVDLQVGNGHGTLRKLRGGLNSAMVAMDIDGVTDEDWSKNANEKSGEAPVVSKAKHLVSVDDLTPKPSTEAMHRFWHFRTVAGMIKNPLDTLIGKFLGTTSPTSPGQIPLISVVKSSIKPHVSQLNLTWISWNLKVCYRLTVCHPGLM